MKIKKHLLHPERLRRIPGQFSWIDQRLIKDRYLQQCDHSALALYLVLVTVADSEGLSYYSDQSLQRLLSLDPLPLRRAREQLCRAGLLAYQAPLYQVLGLELPLEAGGLREPVSRSSQSRSASDILRRIFQEAKP